MPIFIDQTGRSVEVSANPARIISLVPSQSEFLWELGLKDQLVGITKFCIHPEEMFRSAERIGGTKSLNIEKIRALKPDLIIGNKEENERSQIEALQKEFPVWMSDIYTLEDSLSMMQEIGRLVRREDVANRISGEVRLALTGAKNLFNEARVIYFIWKNPYMLAGRNTFIDHVLTHIGFINCARHLERYPQITMEELQQLNPEYCLLSSEPYPFKAKDLEELSEWLPDSKVVMVDGELFSWYGCRLKELPSYLEFLKKQINR